MQHQVYELWQPTWYEKTGNWRYCMGGRQKLPGPLGSVVCLSERSRHSDLQLKHESCW